MAFGIGFVAALVVLRKKNGETRLKTLQKTLKEKPPSKLKLRQYPLQKLLSLLFILVLTFALQWIFLEASRELTQQYIKIAPHLPADDSSYQPIELLRSQENDTLTSKALIAATTRAKVGRLRFTLNCIQLCFGLAFISLLLTLDLRVVSACRGDPTLRVTTYCYLGAVVKQEVHVVEEGERLRVCEMGETRFTNTNYYYQVKIVGREGKEFKVMRKGCMFDARAAAMRLGDLLGLKFSTKVTKGPPVDHTH